MQNLSEIDGYIANTTDWRGEILTKLRHFIHEVDTVIQEEWKM